MKILERKEPSVVGICPHCGSYDMGVLRTTNKMISNTKEMDLEKEYKDFVEKDLVYSKLVNSIVGKAIAKHFFELGLKAQKGK